MLRTLSVRVIRAQKVSAIIIFDYCDFYNIQQASNTILKQHEVTHDTVVLEGDLHNTPVIEQKKWELGAESASFKSLVKLLPELRRCTGYEFFRPLA